MCEWGPKDNVIARLHSTFVQIKKRYFFLLVDMDWDANEYMLDVSPTEANSLGKA